MHCSSCSECEASLSDYLEQSLGAANRAAVKLHLDSCRSCESLLSAMTQVIETASHFPVHMPPPWLASRIVANSPRKRPSLRAIVSAAWRSLGEPRTALAIFTTALVMGWIGGVGVREAIYNRAEGVMSSAYDRAVRSYYRSPVVIELHSRLGQLMENS